MKIPELLGPVGSMDNLKIAINSGASSVYLAGEKYGARSYIANFTLEEIEKAIEISHMHNVKVYIAVNTLIKESELKDVLNYLNKLYNMGVDAVIIQDLGLINLIKKYIPKLKIHASTQMTIENQLKIDFLENLKIKRIVLPRETTKNEIRNIKTNLELEIFAHGALCYSYSGQCLFSSFHGGRSGNRGKCAQPCRMKYSLELNNKVKKDSYYLSPEDLSLFRDLVDISELDIDCIKIEGRVRNKEYLSTVLTSFRKALNRLKSNKEFRTEDINLVFNRGFSKGFFKDSPNKSLYQGHLGLEIGEIHDFKNNQIAIKLNDNLKTIPEKGDGLLILNGNDPYGFEISKNPLLTTVKNFKNDKLIPMKNIPSRNRVLVIKKVRENKKIPFSLNHQKVYLNKRNEIIQKTKNIENNISSYIKSKISLIFKIKNNYPILEGVLTLANNNEIVVKIKGDTQFEKAINKPTNKETIRKQLSKIDKYPFEVKNIKINYNESLFIPISEINKLRREVLEKLEKQTIDFYKPPKHEIKEFKLNKKDLKTDESNISLYVNDLKILKEISNVKRVYFEVIHRDDEINLNYIINILKEAYDISKNKEYELIWKWPDIAHDNIIKNLSKVRGILNKLNYNFKIMSPNFNSDYGPSSMNIANSESIKQLSHYKLLTISEELSKKDIEELMDSYNFLSDLPELEIKVHGNIELIKSRHKIDRNALNLIDSKGNKYPIKHNLSPEGMILLNSKDLSLISEIPYLQSINISNFAIDCRWKDIDYIRHVLNLYNLVIKKEENSKLLKQDLDKTTQGNFYKKLK
jgi:U32 family peptidase